MSFAHLFTPHEIRGLAGRSPDTLPYPILRHMSRWRIAAPRLAVRCCGRPPLWAGGAAGGASEKPLPVRGSGRPRRVFSGLRPRGAGDKMPFVCPIRSNAM